MTNTITIKEDKDLLKVKKGDKIDDQRPKDPRAVPLETSKASYEYHEELIKEQTTRNQ
jgi:hypothetical protein